MTLPISFRNWVMAHDPGVWLSAVWDGPHLQGGDHPGQEQTSVQGALHSLFPRTWQTKGTRTKLFITLDDSACHKSLWTAVWVWNEIIAQKGPHKNCCSYILKCTLTPSDLRTFCCSFIGSTVCFTLAVFQSSNIYVSAPFAVLNDSCIVFDSLYRKYHFPYLICIHSLSKTDWKPMIYIFWFPFCTCDFFMHIHHSSCAFLLEICTGCTAWAAVRDGVPVPERGGRTHLRVWGRYNGRRCSQDRPANYQAAGQHESGGCWLLHQQASGKRGANSAKVLLLCSSKPH